MNAVMVKSDAAGITMYYGAGAGSEQTASAVIADLVDLCRSGGSAHQYRVPPLAFQPRAIIAMQITAMKEVVSGHYLRLDVADPTLAVPIILDHLSRGGVMVQRLAVLDHPRDSGRGSVLVLTEPAQQRILGRAIVQLETLPCVTGCVRTIRLEALE
jgi:homoserine dehydrogenase